MLLIFFVDKEAIYLRCDTAGHGCLKGAIAAPIDGYSVEVSSAIA